MFKFCGPDVSAACRTHWINSGIRESPVYLPGRIILYYILSKHETQRRRETQRQRGRHGENKLIGKTLLRV